jgi:hypothetical protein
VAASCTVMETRSLPTQAAQDTGPSPAEELPGLYRAILERVAELEQVGRRPEAMRFRLQATRTYSNAWDAAGRRSLVTILGRADRALAGESQPRSRTRSLRVRSFRARALVLRRRSAAAR